MILPFVTGTLGNFVLSLYVLLICLVPTMSLDRDKLLSRLSEHKGHTQEECTDSISFLALQMEKDLELVRKVTSKNITDLSQLEGMDKIRGSTKIIQTLKHCNESLEAVEDGCHSFLKLTKKATSISTVSANQFLKLIYLVVADTVIPVNSRPRTRMCRVKKASSNSVQQCDEGVDGFQTNLFGIHP